MTIIIIIIITIIIISIIITIITIIISSSIINSVIYVICGDWLLSLHPLHSLAKKLSIHSSSS